MRRQRRGVKLLALILGLSLVAAACGDDDDGAAEGDTGEEAPAGEPGGELVDLGTFPQGPPEHIDPALNVTLDAYQVVKNIYMGLTRVDFSDPDNPETVGLVAETFESNDDATEWTFTIREGLEFSDGSPVLPSSFVRAWERASDPDFAGDYSYLMNFIDGGAEKLDGSADTLSGVEADDEAMTLTVTMDAPYANFPAVAGFQLFFPMPEAVDDLADQAEWENGIMIGNGPFVMDSPRTDQEIVLTRNENWDGTAMGLETEQAMLDSIRFVISQDVESAYNAFEAGEGDTANLPPGRVTEADSNFATTLDVAILGSYHWYFNQDDPTVGGPDNKLLRQAISQAIDREAINTTVYEGTRTTSTGITPEGIPGWESGLCDYCAYDAEAAQAAYDEWVAAGNELTAPLPIQFNADAGHEPVAQIIVSNLDAIGIPAEATPMESETYFSQLAEGACVVCRAGWYADYPTYDNFMYDLFHSDSLGGNNFGYHSDEFDALVDEAKATTDADAAGELYREAEQIMLNDDIGAIPLNWYRGDYVYNPDTVNNFPQDPQGLVSWEDITVNK